MASNTFVTIDGVNFTKRQHDVLVSKALAVADNEGYCDEAEKMLTEVGFTVPSREQTITLTVKVTMVSRGGQPLTSEDFNVEDTKYGDHFDVESVTLNK